MQIRRIFLVLMAAYLEGGEIRSLARPVGAEVKLFAASRNSEVSWFREIARFESPGTSAVISAVEFTPRSGGAAHTEGVCVLIFNSQKDDQVLIESKIAEDFVRQLEMLIRYYPETRRHLHNSAGSKTTAGSTRKLMSEDTLNAGYCVLAEKAVLCIDTSRGPTYEFPDQTPVNLVEAIRKALSALKSR